MSEALILLPTHDHQDTLYESIEAVRRQSVRDWELVAILDGSPPRSREILEHFARLDRRISFIERAKGPRLGEANRDAVIRASEARIVAHATDDDLWFPLHLRTLLDLLENADFAHTALVQGTTTGAFIGHPASWAGARTRDATLERRFNCTGPNQCGYRREAYLRLERGWESTPPEWPWTDAFMWSKFLRDPAVRRATHLVPTTLKLGVAGREHWSPGRRREELARWSPLTVDAAFPERLAAQTSYCRFYRWSVDACGAMGHDLRSSLRELGVEPVIGVPLAALRPALNDEPVPLSLTEAQARELEETRDFLSQRLPEQQTQSYLRRAVAVDPTDDAMLQDLVGRMIRGGEGAAALEFAAQFAEDTPLKGRRWDWIAKHAAALGLADIAERAARARTG